MGAGRFYVLPKLPYDYKDLEPRISEEQLKMHHEKHRQGYVNGANAIFEKLERARKEGIDLDIKSTLKTLSFNVGGHILHSLFWFNLAPSGEGGGNGSKKMGLRNVVEVDEEKSMFQLFFLKDDEDQSVEVVEVEEIDFREVKKRLKQGESVFITRKRKQKLNTSLVTRKNAAEFWYFSHI